MGTDIDIVSLVRQVLQEIGCADKMDDAVSPHLPLCINLRDGSEIRIDTSSDGVLFIAPMPSVTEEILAHASTLLARFLLRPPNPLFSPCRPVIVWYEDGLSLQAQLIADAQRMPEFRDALEYFFDETCALLHIVRD
ncbi:hypothetical protein [Xanthomonas albilineans]|uniref:hypothetical protein n=1 Tax=Xanthomonas albilineans TaxID=29447 RepID=UPI0005F338AE|nr:hypothetical protein [Xanthomonas albilineans]PPU95106.1 hypothetical protein XalbCFBP2523_01450 [Xanthomonas albilineans]